MDDIGCTVFSWLVDSLPRLMTLWWSSSPTKLCRKLQAITCTFIWNMCQGNSIGEGSYWVWTLAISGAAGFSRSSEIGSFGHRFSVDVFPMGNVYSKQNKSHQAPSLLHWKEADTFFLCLIGFKLDFLGFLFWGGGGGNMAIFGQPVCGILPLGYIIDVDVRSQI